MSLTPLVQAGAPKPKLQHSTRGRWRAAVLILIHVVVAIRVAFYNKTGTTVTPVEPSEAMQTLETGMVNAGFVFFALAILSTLIFGRFFCGWACHIVALQDLCGAILKKLGWAPKPFRSRLLVFVPIFAALYMFVWPQVLRMLEGRPLPQFVSHFKTDDFWITFPGPAVAIFTFVVCGFLAVIFLGNKGFCTYACPYGAAFYAADRFAKGKIRVTDACNGCGHCTAVCTSNVRIHEEVKLHKMVVDPACMKCMDCISVCPNQALYFGFGKGAGKLRPKRQFDFTWAEELTMAVVFLFSLYAVRGLYEWFPFLLSLGWSAILAYFSVVFLRLLRAKSVKLQRFQLKRAGQVSGAGLAFGIFMSLLLGAHAHAAVLQFNFYEAMGHLDSAQAIYEGKREAKEGEADDLVRRSYAEFEQVKAMAWVPVATWDARQGAIQVFLGDEEKAEAHFKRSLELNPNLLSALTPLIELYERQGRWAEIEPLAKRWSDRYPLRSDPARVMGVALQNQGRTEEAKPWFDRAVRLNPKDAAALLNMGMIAASASDFPKAIELLDRAIVAAPTDPRAAYNKALVQAESGRLPDGVATLTELLTRQPDYLAGHNLRAQMAARANLPEIAMESADVMRKAEVVQPEMAGLWADSAMRLPNAAARLEKLTQSVADRYYSAALLVRLGKTAEAEKIMGQIRLERTPPPGRPW